MLKILGYRRSSSSDARRVIRSHFTRCFSTVLVPSTPTISREGVRSPDSSLLKRCLSQSHQHPNQKSCWKCGSAIAQGCTLFCESPSCGAIQGLNEKECNYFKLFDVEEGFSLDSEQLEVAFKNLQRQLHPDKFAMSSLEERERSTFNSSFVNQAFQVIVIF
jgi:hypothetical protein